ncbi:MAG: ABC transporter substrate-binding protein [Micrococcus sp.]|nr:ABC transporter substrate-binding protein [Micrococcus sp.]
MSAFDASTSRRSFLRYSGIAASAAGLAATLAACGSSDDDAAERTPTTGNGDQGQIVASISYELGTNGYDPMTTTSALTIAANWHTMEGLTEVDPATREVYAALADSLPEPGSDTSFEITLRDGATFHNGETVTAEDVVYSFERVLDEENNSLYAGFIPFISSVTAKDEKTVTFELAYPVGVIAERLSVVKIVPQAAVEADAEGFDANPVGTGPYSMTDNGASSGTVRFEKFADYSGPKPARAASMVWNIMPDPSARTNALSSGEVQAIDSVPYLSIPQLEGSSEVESVQGFGLLFAMFNHAESSPFSDVKARQAFLYALDMDEIIGTGLRGQAEAATCFVHREHPAYQEAAMVYTKDQDKARELFQEAGISSFRLMATDHDWVKACTPIIQQNLQAAGVTVDFSERQSSDAYNTIDGSPEAYDALIAPGDPSVFGNDADLLMRWWYGSEVWTDSRMHWKGSDSHATMQELLDTGLRATDESVQMDTWHEAFDLVSEEVPLYPLFHRKTPTAWDADSLSDFTPISLTGLSFVGVGSNRQ